MKKQTRVFCYFGRSPDTDVAVLALMLCTQYPTLFFQTGTKQRTRVIPLYIVSSKLGNDVCSALVGLHAFTGCDPTSAFVGKGKKTAFDLVTRQPRFAATMAQLGQ